VQSGCSNPLILKLARSCILEAGPVNSLTGKKAEKIKTPVLLEVFGIFFYI
jgi:hypothetical protein